MRRRQPTPELLRVPPIHEIISVAGLWAEKCIQPWEWRRCWDSPLAWHCRDGDEDGPCRHRRDGALGRRLFKLRRIVAPIDLSQLDGLSSRPDPFCVDFPSQFVSFFCRRKRNFVYNIPCHALWWVVVSGAAHDTDGKRKETFLQYE
ncbi:hypothetical protein VPH35_056427 [Triticum aestivum]